MKILFFLSLILSPLFVVSASHAEWAWNGEPNDTACRYTEVRKSAPRSVETGAFPILAVYTWKNLAPCIQGKDSTQRTEIKAWAARLDRSLINSKQGFVFAIESDTKVVRTYFYVLNPEELRFQSHQAGELLVEAAVRYHFERDLDWAEWEELKIAPEKIGLAQVHRE